MKLVLASSNAGKLEELHALLDDVGVELIAQSTLGVSDADETGLTFVENALLKARHAARVTGLPALADDSGICVDALHGAPGLYSARYAGEHGNAQANIDKLLDALRDVPDAQRGAHFYCVLVLLRHAEDPQPLLVEGRWRGRIAHARAGTGGHGYDPVFLDPDHGQTAAEMPLALKNRISHRALALQQLKQRLADHLAAHPAE
ncbi:MULTISPECIES: RdgB/HAM1 family non-canonical purine NTP pyrophosphatase [Xanthomonas]|uniref:RdgB/HAM1 family non-canonical purine NTP pyrophosphatase n=1 Tax=Xanthomonas TaxID=338 RepID=UPI00126458BB|nr:MULTISPECIES: RdgB/HAM1 family non-canonical purine NTP pyrophosphatase [Xanthomonas]KAB7763384.1 non-canonical purine NTP pyrophosphatase, RdgB/HAM1 family [Xanthomonas sp. LMG 12461]MCW0374074.1 dITP/XTP pyrophosphatase [Xanthomonas sacchari]MCW0387820.1 dITP/XTP pyrophosphatase [Xanthomonas sacchari]MCW0448589.1 dITP/XTP pyrophosphatase [Xanthomonas sacchari]MDY4297286.1 RdgB/HAM1 family non-canonical purine NTP pyrophosphatase [Xanthomonas sp. LF02-5]